MAYEILKNMSNDSLKEFSYNYKADLWSIGIIFYQMLQGETPFHGFTTEMLIQNIEENYSKLNFPHEISSEAKDLIDKLLQIDPKKRIDWIEVLNHPLL